ncbi:unnamed protein product [Phaedon cochleariae]|uniref:Uncharacterized protein n=1 Tax=Phaedon cochleariae TaxID=80249 RepID=A0A9P0DEX5_PHACE|nr:unnamed protein product [Phaedon cochleariae]
MYKLAVFCLLIAKSLAQNCSLPNVSALVQRRIDSEGEIVSFDDKIQLAEDAFYLLVNQSLLPSLCQGSVKILDELSIIQIRNCSLMEIEPDAFDITPTLSLLKISYNPLAMLKKGIFRKVRSKEIDLSHNAITSIEEGTFSNSTWLEIVRLSYNAIKKLDPDWFLDTPNLYKLSVIYNELTVVPSAAFQNLAKNRSLKLRLSANMISRVEEDAFAGVGNIRNLWMNGNKLRTLPESLFQNRTIDLLEVNSNKLLCFPDSIYLSDLKRLEFFDNRHFSCECLQEVRNFVEERLVEVWYPAIICENATRGVNIVYNLNRTYEIPLLTPSN